MTAFDRFDLAVRDGKVPLRWRADWGSRSFEASLTFDGSLRTFALVALINLPSEMLPDVVLLDEPELGLHPSVATLIGGVISSLFARRQVMVATQSPSTSPTLRLDPDTGKVELLRFTAIQDCGKAIHSGYVEGQIQGGAVQGIGWGLNEEYCFDADGQMLNSSFLDYRMPTTLDLPMIDTVIVGVANPGHPLGVRGVGEVSLVPPMAAIGNATGARMENLPMNPGAVLEALWGQNGG